MWAEGLASQTFRLVYPLHMTPPHYRTEPGQVAGTHIIVQVGAGSGSLPHPLLRPPFPAREGGQE